MKNGIIKKIFLCAVAGFMLAYVVFQVFTSLNNTIKTEHASYYTFNDTIVTKAYVVKSETVLDPVGNGTVNYLTENGNRVSRGTVVAQSFSTEQQADAMVKANEAKEKIEQYEKIVAVGNNYLAAETDKIKKRLNEKIYDFLDVTDSNNLKMLEEKSSDLLGTLNENQLALGNTTDFTAKIAQLTAEKQSFEAIAGEPISEITASESGYYVNSTDSHEGLVSTENIAEISCDEIESALEHGPVSLSYDSGKIITGLEWYFTCILNEKQTQTLSLGDQVEVFVPNVISDAVDARVVALNFNRSADRCAVVLECTEMTSALSSLRIENIEICTGTYTGLRVPADAVRVVDGVTGVYVLSGVSAKFKAIDILYTDKGFVVCAADNTNSSSLALYEEVIISGSDLYDGKVVK